MSFLTNTRGHLFDRRRLDQILSPSLRKYDYGHYNNSTNNQSRISMSPESTDKPNPIFTLKQSALTNGYIKKYLVYNHTKLYPMELNQIILESLGNVLLRFDVIEKGQFRKYIDENGKHIRIPDSICYPKHNFACSVPINQGVTYFNIECIKKSGHEAIGIISSLDQCKSRVWISNFTCYKYIWYDEDAIVAHKYLRKIYSTKRRGYNETPKWNEGDMITVKVDCVNWKVTFYLNRSVQFEWNICRNMKYYLVLQAFDYGEEVEYRLMDPINKAMKKQKRI